MDWDDPADRCRLALRVGPEEYNRLHKAHMDATVVDTVNGHRIRPVSSRFGRIYIIDGAGVGYPDLERARDEARLLPPRVGESN